MHSAYSSPFRLIVPKRRKNQRYSNVMRMFQMKRSGRIMGLRCLKYSSHCLQVDSNGSLNDCFRNQASNKSR